MARDDSPIADDDAAAAWRALVQRTVAGATVESLATADEDAILVRPLYRREDAVGSEGVPGLAPLVRAASAAGRLPSSGWESRQLHALPSPADTAAAIAEDLAGGVRGVWLRLQLGAPEAAARGVVVRTLSDLLEATAPLDPRRHTLALDPGPCLRACAALLLAWHRRGAPESPRLAVGLDPLGAAALGELPSPDEALAVVRELLPPLADAFPEARLLVADGVAWHEAGATSAQEIAATIATAIALLRLSESAGLDPAAAARRIELRLACDADIFASAAKCRALRRLWSRVLAALDLDTAPFLHAVTGRRMLARVDPWTNMLRLTAASLAAGLGGADAVTTLPFDDPHGPPDTFSRRIARNTQAILALESRIFQPVDPAGGSFFLQRHTDELAQAAWRLVREIEAVGGMPEALRRGLVQERVEEAARHRAAEVATRRRLLVGVSAFADLDEEPRPAATPPAPTAPAAERTVAVEERGLDELVDALAADAALATAPRRHPTIRVLRPRRLAEPFEALRARAAARKARHGDEPRVVALRFGPAAASVGDAGTVKNLFEAGGIRTVERRVADVEAACAALREENAVFAAVCGAPGEETAAALPAALRRAGALRVYAAAGLPPLAAYDARLGDDIDALALLDDAWRALEET